MPLVPITAFHAGVLALLYFALAFMVIRGRRQMHISIGTGGDPRFERAVRAHGNFSEYVPFTLLLMGLAELNGVAALYLHLLGSTLLAGRLLHGWCFVFSARNLPVRVAGMVLTFSALIAGALFGIGAMAGP